MIQCTSIDNNRVSIPAANSAGYQSHGNDTIGGNARLVNVQNSNEAVKTSQEPIAASYQVQSGANIKPVFSLPHNSDSASIKQISTNMKTQSMTTASSVPTNLDFKTSHLPQDIDHKDSNKEIIRKMSDNSEAKCHSDVKETLNNCLRNDTKINLTKETNRNSEPNVKMRDQSIRTDSSDNRDNHLPAKITGAIEEGVTKNLFQAPGVMSKNLASKIYDGESKPIQKSLDLSVFEQNRLQNKKDELCVRKNIDSTTKTTEKINSCYPSSLKNTPSIDEKTKSPFETSTSSSKSLAALEQAIADKKATAMLPIQKLSSSIQPKSSFFGGGGGSKLVDGLLKQAEARAAKEASVAAAAAASAKKNVSKEDSQKDTILSTSNQAHRLEKNDEPVPMEVVDKGKLIFCLFW